MTKQEKIAQKVKHLLAIAGDDAASDAEIQNAMNHAHKLMGEYHLSEEDLSHEPQDDYSDVDNAEFDRQRAFVGKKAFQWECSLARFISEFVGIPYYLTNKTQIVKKNGFAQFDENDDPRYGKSFVFYGVAEDSKIAVELYDELRMLIATMAVASWGSVYKGEGAVYSQGFVVGLDQQLKEAEKLEHHENSTTAMVLVHRREDLIEYEKKKAGLYLKKEHGITLRKGAGRPGGRGGHKAFSQGKADGRKTSVSAARANKLN